MQLSVVNMMGLGVLAVALSACASTPDRTRTGSVSSTVAPRAAGPTIPGSLSVNQSANRAAVTSASFDKTVSVEQGISHAVKFCTSQGPKFEGTETALVKADYKIDTPIKSGKGKHAFTIQDALSPDEKFIVKLGASVDGSKNCQVLFRSRERSRSEITQALSSDPRIRRFAERGSGIGYRFAQSGHLLTPQGPLNNPTSNDVGVLFVISQVREK